MTLLPSYQRMLKQMDFGVHANTTARYVQQGYQSDHQSLGCAPGRRLVASASSECSFNACTVKSGATAPSDGCSVVCNRSHSTDADECSKSCDCTVSTRSATTCWMLCVKDLDVMLWSDQGVRLSHCAFSSGAYQCSDSDHGSPYDAGAYDRPDSNYDGAVHAFRAFYAVIGRLDSDHRGAIDAFYPVLPRHFHGRQPSVRSERGARRGPFVHDSHPHLLSDDQLYGIRLVQRNTRPRDQEVIELLSSSDEASSSDSQSSRARRRSPSSSNDEEGKAQLKPSRRRLVRTSSVSSSGQRRKRHASSSSASSQEESDDSAEEHETLVQLKRPVKKPKVAATKTYVAPTPRPRADRRAAGEMRQITEGMSFYELQAQEQMMARFQNQNRRKAPATKPQAEHRSNLRETSTAPRQLKEKVSASELQAQERAIKQFHRQKARKSAPYAYTSESESGESEESEEKDDEWDRFTKVSTQREVVQKQKQNVATSRTSAVVNSHRETARKSAGSGSRTGDNRRASGKQQAARKMAVPKSQGQKTAKGALDRKPSKTRPGALPKKQSRDLLSEEESEEDSEEESEEPSEEESSEDEVELVAPPRQEKSSSNKKNVSKRPASASPSTTCQPKVSVPMVPPPTNAAQSSLRSVLHGVSETQHIAEKISFRELQAQEEALKFWRKRNSAGAPSTARKGEHSASTNGTRTAPKTNVSGRRARMGASQQETPATSSSLTCIAPPARNGFLAPSAQIVSAAGCTATPVKKLVDPVIHSTAWRRLVFEEAPPNILHAVSTTPFSTGFDKPLWEYDPKGELKKKCKFVAAAGQGVAITEENFLSQSPSQSEVNTRWTGILRPIKFFVASGTGVYSGRKLRIISHG
ncbi:hypothetical protein PR001_g21587 [Phytophthora rubi]|uniref:Uncharacterized protein n=1 Tax=Phytophthora rubi TaxID=129364 RepID=A0A6A3J6T3_9STRA|nr:hypothetical protein PR001_g21587 [Phytophthora rubi]